MPMSASSKDLRTFSREDVFELEWAANPQISPDGERIVYERKSMDIMADKRIGRLWLIDADGDNHMPLTGGEAEETGAQWSPQGDRIAFIRDSQIHVHWLASGKTTRITQLLQTPSALSWSPDGKQLAFSMLVPETPPMLVEPMPVPEGAQWPEAPSVTTSLRYERDGVGRLKPGFSHYFLVDASGGSARQLTHGNFHHQEPPQWLPDGSGLVFSANRNDNWELDFRESELYLLQLDSGSISALTDRRGPDQGPAISPDGRYVSWYGYDDRVQAYQVSQLYVMALDGGEPRALRPALDRSVSALRWDSRSRGVYYVYSNHGESHVAYSSLRGDHRDVATTLGGESMARPYGGGSYSVASNGRIAYTYSDPQRPAELALARPGSSEPRLVTRLNADLLPFRELGRVEPVWYQSSVDERDLQGWIIKPPGYEEGRAYPLLVENHGGPISHYGPHFSPELQLCAAAGYLVFYPNPRGSTSYGEEFANLLFNNYPAEDYQDVMDGVDYLIDQGLTAEDRLYVTGGSAGGIMTAWIVGSNQRFRAAAVIKPVMNWISKLLTADNYYAYAEYRYPGQVWENPETYWKFSPVSLVGNIHTPTMVMVGSSDLRTPLSEAKQLYHALQIRGIDTALVEVPEAPHFIAKRPSQLVTKIDHILAWFARYPWQQAGAEEAE
ncbi:S9 family peptidase [Seongchinamella sediminis]|uniref:S9 family peptidase n=2 Tax=Seongchinamella sediminis TaxID=2283635 RepID=A0A3L7DYU8_9GAMM|nr:S9 family peptidase [Seongchinamella sediminis]